MVDDTPLLVIRGFDLDMRNRNEIGRRLGNRFMKTEIAAFAGALFTICVVGAVIVHDSLPANSAPAAAAKTFTDCSGCPDMVVIPAGAYTMGSPPSEEYRGAEPQHRVAVPAFALSKHEVTFAQWEMCVSDGGCGGFRPDDQGWGKGIRPVIGVSWNDAKAYVAWLGKKTGKPYRLPSEAEWEYGARAGTGTTFSFGPKITSEQANYDASTGNSIGAAGLNRQRTTPVGSFPANAFGLYDMHGNVWEWTEDCWSDEYTADTPANGAPYLGDNCGGRVMRGGSWEDYPGDIRAAARRKRR
jgi:formylglycine-generating enzyme required for sulfatase activity